MAIDFLNFRPHAYQHNTSCAKIERPRPAHGQTSNALAGQSQVAKRVEALYNENMQRGIGDISTIPRSFVG